jgi:hypothetical protein
MPHLELHLHDCGPLDIVGLGEGGPPTAGTDVSGIMGLLMAMFFT